MRHLADSSSFIEAKNTYYGFGICPAFWDFIARQNRKGNFASVTRVADELSNHGDDLSEWVSRQDTTFFLPPDGEVIRARQKISEWASCQNFGTSYVADFVNGADAWLVAHALVHDATVVTQEKLVTAESTKIKIPNVCENFEVPCINIFEMLHRLGARFVLEDDGDC